MSSLTLDQLRQQYKQASSDKERNAIELKAKILKGELYQCYFEDNGERCKSYQVDYWCGDEHRIAWQESNYVDNRQRGEHRVSIQEIQRRLKEKSVKKETI